MLTEKAERIAVTTSPIPWWKRPMDLIIGSTALVLTSPIMLLVALAIKLTSRGEIIFKQERPGLNGRSFTLYKFRTMYVNNGHILEEYLQNNPKALEEWKRYKKLRKHDPRLTPVGRFLRKFSLDELPQLINVLKGEMSIVGPRPYLFSELEEHNVPEEILSVKPGLTGLWQVSGRNELPFEERIRLDLEYVRKMSFWLDLKIILKTFFVVVTGKGAY